MAGEPANSRKNIASALTNITLFLLSNCDGMPELRHLRDTPRHWAFRPRVAGNIPEREKASLAWVAERFNRSPISLISKFSAHCFERSGPARTDARKGGFDGQASSGADASVELCR